MQIVNLEDFKQLSFSVVTIGTFDGVHIGHQAILKKLVDDAKAFGGKSVLVTFWPHPRFILNKDVDKLKLLSTFEEKAAEVAALGVDYLLKIEFTPAFSNLSAEEFVRDILVNKIGTKRLYIGYDHHFGNNREGNIDFLREKAEEYAYEVFEIHRQDIDDIGVSSTKIRKALEEGDIQMANALLGRPYSLTGNVVHGNKKGRSIGFPTANIEIVETYKLLPSDGVYAVNVFVKEHRYQGMLNIGFKPTVAGISRTIEVHLFNFDEQIYGENVTIMFIDRLREEMKFDSIVELKAQLKLDKINAIKKLV